MGLGLKWKYHRTWGRTGKHVFPPLLSHDRLLLQALMLISGIMFTCLSSRKHTASQQPQFKNTETRSRRAASSHRRLLLWTSLMQMKPAWTESRTPFHPFSAWKWVNHWRLTEAGSWICWNIKAKLVLTRRKSMQKNIWEVVNVQIKNLQMHILEKRLIWNSLKNK